jgi:hypothetical protein
MTHGAKSEIRIKAKARAARRRFLRQQRLRAGDLDGICHAFLDGWARATAKVELWDEHDPLGAGSREYIAASNSARLFMSRLDVRLKELGLDRARQATPLDRFLAERENGDPA